MRQFFSLPNLTLIVALALSGVAAYYSIIGLTAIFAGAVIPIVVMGIILEIAKITTTVWLRTFWKQCGWVMKSYLVPAVIVLALITSMGIFGFLSKSHLDQGVPTGDVAAKVSLFDEKIKTQRENIASARAALSQMDLQVNNVITKGDTERSAERSVQIRRQQAGERGKLQKEIETANNTIAKLNEEKAPISSQLRKVEAEVGPIKYIAAMIYGDNPDQNILEKAVRWVIILLVLVFDPLAIALILAANQSKYWKIERPEEEIEIGPKPDDPISEEEQARAKAAVDFHLGPDDDTFDLSNEPLTDDQVFQAIVESATPSEEKTLAELHPYLNATPSTFKNDVPLVAPHLDTPVTEEPEEFPKVEIELKVPELEVTHNDLQFESTPNDIQTEGVTEELADGGDGYVVFHSKHMANRVFEDMHPDVALTVDSTHSINTNFGSEFPKIARRGDVFVRVDVLPNRVYKFDGSKWLLINKDTTTVYLQDPAYIQHLIGKIDQGEYDVDLLSPDEKQQIEEYLQKPSQ
jgi:hypothetical protein